MCIPSTVPRLFGADITAFTPTLIAITSHDCSDADRDTVNQDNKALL
jgi:hypothetical protein